MTPEQAATIATAERERADALRRAYDALKEKRSRLWLINEHIKKHSQFGVKVMIRDHSRYNGWSDEIFDTEIDGGYLQQQSVYAVMKAERHVTQLGGNPELVK